MTTSVSAIPPHHHEETVRLLGEIRDEMRAELKTVRVELDEFRVEVRAELAKLHKTTDFVAVHLGEAFNDIQFLKTRFGRLEADTVLVLPLMRGLAIEIAQIKNDLADVKAELVSARSDRAA